MDRPNRQSPRNPLPRPSAPNRPSDPTALRTIRQVAEERPFATERWLRSLVFEKRLPYYKAGKRVLIDLADLDAYVATGRVDSVD